MSAKRLNSAALPSMTGIAAAGPMLPSPSTADPSLTTATVFRLMVSRRASAGFSAIAMHPPHTPAPPPPPRRSRHHSPPAVGLARPPFRQPLDLAAQMQQERAVGHLA